MSPQIGCKGCVIIHLRFGCKGNIVPVDQLCCSQGRTLLYDRAHMSAAGIVEELRPAGAS